MRKIAILVIISIVCVYLVSAHLNQHRFRVPDYAVIEVDILNGATVTRWNSDEYATARHKRLNALGKKKYQPVEQIVVSATRTLQPSDVLVTADFQKITSVSPEELPAVRRIKVKDAQAIRSFVQRKMALREEITLKDGSVLAAGDLLKKEDIDRLLQSGVTDISVVGKGAVVGINATVLMVILIFNGMVLTLKSIFWEPMMTLLATRRKVLEEGVECLKNNAKNAELLKRDREEMLRRIHRSCTKVVSDARQRAMKEADVIIKDIRRKMHTMRNDAKEELDKTMTATRKQIQDELPKLAEAIVATITSKS